MDRMQTTAMPALARLLMSVIFIIGGYGKLMAAGPTIAYIGSGGLPLPELAYWVAVAVELGGGILILFGLQTRLAALGMAIWCLLTGAIFHFAPGNQAMMVHFLKNVCMAGGFLMLAAYGAGAWSIDGVLNRRGTTVASAI